MELDEAEALANVLEAIADMGDRLAMAEYQNQRLRARVDAAESMLLKLAGEWMEGSDDENCSAPGLHENDRQIGKSVL